MAELLLKIIGICAMIAIPAASLLTSLNLGRPHFKSLTGLTSMLFRYSLAMFIIMPTFAVLMYFLTGKDNPLWLGVMTISLSPAAPGIIKSMKKLEGNQELSSAWFLISILYCVILTPLSVLILEQVFSVDLDLGFDNVLMKMLTFFILPMIAGFLIYRFAPGIVETLKKILNPVVKITMLVMIVALLIVSVPMIMKQGLTNILLSVGFLIVALLLGLLFGYPERQYGPILPFSLVMRLPASAIILAQINNFLMQFAPVILMYILLGTILMAVAKKLIFNKSYQ
jgi:predicted Na+-dependent transporter